MNKLLVLLLTCLVLSHFSCTNSTQSENGNSTPQIEKITVYPQPPITDVWIALSAVATDKDGDTISYFWTCSGGSFLSNKTNINPITWKTYEIGNFTFECTVSDGKNTSSKTITLDVQSN